MSLFRIAYRSILQRGVGSTLTMLSMSLGVALVVAVLSIHGVVSQSFRNNASLGYNMIVGAKGGREQLTLSTVYYLSSPVENIPYTYYLEFLNREQRDRLLADSFAAKGGDAVQQTAELAALGDGGLAGASLAAAIAPLGTSLVPDLTDKKMHAPPVELGRHGKFGQMNELAIPLCQGDYYGRFKVVGTIPAFFDLVWDVENNRTFEFAHGRSFKHQSDEHGYFEAVVGATVAREMELQVGDGINPAHGDPEGHTHARQFTVVGILAPTGTPHDRAVFVNMEGFYLMEDHAKPIEDEPTEQAAQPREMTEQEWNAYRQSAQSQQKMSIERMADPEPLPVEQREVTAILLKVPAMVAPGLENAINEGVHAQAVLPVAVIYGLFEFIINPIQWTLLLLTGLICVVSGISILVSIYNSMSERRGEIAVMRALGAGRGTVMSIILLEATLLALGGGVLGWAVGHAGTYAVSPWIEEHTGVQLGLYNWEPAFPIVSWLGLPVSNAERYTLPVELVLLPALVLLAILVGIWPALSAYWTDVAKSLGR